MAVLVVVGVGGKVFGLLVAVAARSREVRERSRDFILKFWSWVGMVSEKYGEEESTSVVMVNWAAV